jgi:hypothetical protein
VIYTSILLSPSRFDNVCPGIKRAFHALALDELRRPFTPNLWSLGDLEAVDRECACTSLLHLLSPSPVLTLPVAIDLQQCWFPGVHSNVGGGYPDRALSDLSLAWMIDLCRSLLDFDIDHLTVIAFLHRNPEVGHKMEPKGAGNFNNSHQGYGGGRCYDSYKEGQTWTWKHRTPLEYGELTNETMHASVWERCQANEGKSLMIGPAAWKPEGFGPSDREWVKKGNALVIKEARFPATVEHSSTEELRSLERLLRFEKFIDEDDNVFRDILVAVQGLDHRIGPGGEGRYLLYR